MIKTNNGYLDFDDIIEVERQVKLFEEIATTDGDFSYQFRAPQTSNNLYILGFPFPDNKTKLVYHEIEAILLSDDGLELYRGFLRIEGLPNNWIYLSFFAGNNNWFGMLSGNLSELDFSEYDVDQTQSTIQAAIFNTEGIVFPLVDNGILDLRGYQLLKVEDFVAGIYVKTVFNKIFASHGIKIQGEILNDVNYQSAITLSAGNNTSEIDARTTYVHTTNSPSPHDATYHKMVWTDDTNFPYSDGEQNNFDISLGRYVADIKMSLKVELTINEIIAPGAFGDYKIAFYINGILSEEKVITLNADMTVFTAIIKLESGDYLEAFVYNDATIYADPITDASWRITPIFLYKAFGNSVVPDWTQQQYVSNILRLFNVLAAYNATNKTLTFNLFERIKDKPPIDLSEYLSETDVDYTEFISEYGKKSLLSFQELETEDTFRFTRFRYAKGVINVDNDFLTDSEDILESDFTQPIGYINPVFNMSIEKTDLIMVEEEVNVDVTGVTNSLGFARFAISEDVFELSDLVRVSNSTNQKYNGDYMVDTLGAGYVELSGLQFDTNATATIGKMNFGYTDNDNVYLLHHVPLYSINNFSGLIEIRLENTDLETIALAFFNLLNQNRQINIDFVNSMSFSGEDNPLHYQQTLIEQYFSLFSGVLNDPVKIKPLANLPYKVFINIDFLRPITIKTIETSNMYYLNRITGYEASEKQCTLELIKLASVERENTPAELVTPEILQAIQVGIANGSVVDLNFTNPLTPGSKVMFFMANVANGVINMTLQENTGNPNITAVFESYGDVLLPVGETDPANAIGQHAIYVLDVIDPDDTFQFEWVVSDGNTHYSCGFAIEIAAGAEWDQAGMNQDLGYSNTLSHPVFLNGTSITSVPDVVMSQNQNLFIPIGISMGLSPGGNAFDAPFGGLNPSGGVNPAGVLMGFAWNGVALPEAGDYGGLVFQTTSGISGERQWLNWGNFYIP